MRSFFATLRQLVLPMGSGSTSPRIVLGPDVPADLQTYYTGLGTPVVSCVLFYGDNGTDYRYEATCNFSGFVLVVTGLSVGGTIRESLAEYRGSSLFNSYDLGSQFPIGVHIGSTSRSPAVGETFRIEKSVDFLIDLVSHGRGLLDRVDSTSSSAAVGAEAIVLTGNTITAKDGRAYRICWRLRAASSVANTITHQVRKTNLAGAVVDTCAFPAAGTTAMNFYEECVVKRTAGAGDLSINFVLTAAASTGTVTDQAGTTNVRFLEVWDCGAAADFPNALAL